LPPETGPGFELESGQHTKRKEKLSALRDARSGLDFVLESPEFQDRKRCSLMGKNRFLESVTVDVVVIECRVSYYDTNKGKSSM
jgi:hypothetical protein